MEKTFIVDENNCVKSAKIECTPAEYLVVNKALKLMGVDYHIHMDDRKLAQELSEIEPKIIGYKWGLGEQ